jgi:plastocyanin
MIDAPAWVNHDGDMDVGADMNRYSLAAGATALALVLTACSSSSTSSPKTSTPATSAASGAVASSGIVIKNFGYSGTLTVKAGQKVTVTNQDSAPHTVTDKKSHLFDTGNIAAGGGTGTFTAPSKPGSYPFGCTYHPQMAGTLVVQ